MSYTPPLCNAADFQLLPYEGHSCLSADFELVQGTSEYVWITSSGSAISLLSSAAETHELNFVSSNDTKVPLFCTDALYQWVHVVESDNSNIHIGSQVLSYEGLSDITTGSSKVRVIATSSSVNPGEEQDVANALRSGGYLYGWGFNSEVDILSKYRWDDIANIDNIVTVKPPTLIWEDYTASDSWNVLDYADTNTSVFIDSFFHAESFAGDDWVQCFIVDDQIEKVTYGGFVQDSTLFIVPYREPGACDCEKAISYYGFNEHSITFSFQYQEPGACDCEKVVPWGPIELYPYCNRTYTPPSPCLTVFNALLVPQNPVGICHEVLFEVDGYNTDRRCPYKHNRTGSRDPYIYGKPNPLLQHALSKEAYYMLNTVFVKTHLTQQYIEVLAVSATIDKQSWLWQFNLTIGDKAGLDLVKPVINLSNEVVFIDIEIYINGWKFSCRVEGWSENKSFGKTTWNITGRSPSMELGSPQNPICSFTYDNTIVGAGTAGGQIMEAILEGTMLGRADLGWDIDWGFYNLKVGGYTGFAPTDGAYWDIPDKTFTWTDKTQIEPVQELAASIGAYLQTHNDCLGSGNKKLIVKPHFHEPPWKWHWETGNLPVYKDDVPEGQAYDIDHLIPEGLFREVGRSFVSYPLYTGVFVMGQNSVPAISPNVTAGVVLADVYRAGVGPSYRVRAANVTSPWVTSAHSAGEAGRPIICETGEWVKHSINLFSLAQYGDADSDLVKLVLPGEMVQVTEAQVDWFGQVESTTISASMVSGAAVSVSQSISVNQYIGK